MNSIRFQKSNYVLEQIKDFKKNSEEDPSLLERVLFAFELLEALRKAKMPFIL